MPVYTFYLRRAYTVFDSAYVYVNAESEEVARAKLRSMDDEGELEELPDVVGEAQFVHIEECVETDDRDDAASDYTNLIQA